VKPNVEGFAKKNKKQNNYANVDINTAFKAKMKVFKDDLIDID
jgi:hypothetical protein